MPGVNSSSIHIFPKMMLVFLLDYQVLTVSLGMMSMLTRLRYGNGVHVNQTKISDKSGLLPESVKKGWRGYTKYR